MKLFSIQFESFEPIVFSMVPQESLLESGLLVDLPCKKEKGWTRITRWGPREQNQLQTLALHHTKVKRRVIAIQRVKEVQ